MTVRKFKFKEDRDRCFMLYNCSSGKWLSCGSHFVEKGHAHSFGSIREAEAKFEQKRMGLIREFVRLNPGLNEHEARLRGALQFVMFSKVEMARF